MARKQVLVQLDDALVAMLDEAARREGVSRSEILREAAKDHLYRRHIDLIDRQLIEAYRRMPDGEEWNDEYAKGLVAEDSPPYGT